MNFLRLLWDQLRDDHLQDQSFITKLQLPSHFNGYSPEGYAKKSLK